MINVEEYLLLTNKEGEMITNMVTPIVMEDYTATMLAPIMPMPNAAGNLLATLSCQVRL